MAAIPACMKYSIEINCFVVYEHEWWTFDWTVNGYIIFATVSLILPFHLKTPALNLKHTNATFITKFCLKKFIQIK